MTCTCIYLHNFLYEIVTELGKVEDEIFRNRRDREIKDKERRKQQSKRQKIVSNLLIITHLILLINH